jgi:hypothetical protein
MDIVYVLIGFACGFICREIIFHKQVARARQHFETLLKQQGEKHGDNQ